MFPLLGTYYATVAIINIKYNKTINTDAGFIITNTEQYYRTNKNNRVHQ